MDTYNLGELLFQQNSQKMAKSWIVIANSGAYPYIGDIII